MEYDRGQSEGENIFQQYHLLRSSTGANFAGNSAHLGESLFCDNDNKYMEARLKERMTCTQ